ncbi:MAG: hypothetical protein ACOX50_00115 [Patescibacteria group bacterium]|jgi:hypothetical protein
MKKILSTAIFFLTLVLISTQSAQADTLTNAKDTISNSRPSAISTIGVGASTGSTKLTLTNMDTNPFSQARYIASDSALLFGAPGTIETIHIASMSAILGNSASLYTTAATTQNHNVGATVMMASTAQHVISFRTVQPIDNGGKIEIVFPPGNSTNTNYPSFNGFSFNNLTTATANSLLSASGATCSSWTITPSTGSILCTLGAAINTPTTVMINIGLTSTNPVLINPAKTNVVGEEDSWTLRIRTIDSAGTEKDTAKVRIATIESVEVYATVDPYINFEIDGLDSGSNFNTGNAGCTMTGSTNSGFDSTETQVNLGVLASTRINTAAQLLTVATNAINGYTLTATSSGHLRDDAIGYWLTDAQQSDPTNHNTPIPAAMNTGTPSFGIHPCGEDATTTGPDWSGSANQTCTIGSGVPDTECLFANPSAKYYYTLATDNSGPIGGGTDGLTTVVYAAAISNIVPAGTYRTTITYVATATF